MPSRAWVAIGSGRTPHASRRGMGLLFFRSQGLGHRQAGGRQKAIEESMQRRLTFCYLLELPHVL